MPASSAALDLAQGRTGAANDCFLYPLPAAIAADLAAAVTDVDGGGEAMAVHASPWRWSVPRRREISGAVTFRRWTPEGVAFDLVCSVTLDLDVRGAHSTRVVVRLTDESRIVSGQHPTEQWWVSPRALRPVELRLLADLAREAWDCPPRVHVDAGVVDLELDGGSLGTMRGELRIVEGDTVEEPVGFAFIVVTDPGALAHDRAVLALRRAVLDGRCSVPAWIRGEIERGLDILAVQGGSL